MRMHSDAVESAVQGVARLPWIAPITGFFGLLFYNWWVGAWVEGILPTPNMMFSDLEVAGSQYFKTLSGLDLAAGIFMLAALVLAGSAGRKREWWLLIGFALSGIVGAMFPYTCAEAIDSACRRAEWTFQLPAAHYGHIVAGVAEFAFATAAIWFARQRLRGGSSQWARLADLLWLLMLIGYPLIAVTYLTDHAMAFVEPIFLLAFSARIVMALFEPPAPETESVARSAHA